MWKLRRTSSTGRLLFVALGLGCADGRLPTEGGEVVEGSASAVCGEECAIFVDTRPLNAARIDVVHPDSADGGVFLADFAIDGRVGDAVRARLDLPSEVPEELLAARVAVETNGGAAVYSFRELASSTTVFEFTQAGALDIRYSLERGGAAAPDLAMRLVQVLDGGSVTSALTPWAARPSPTVFGHGDGSGLYGRGSGARDVLRRRRDGHHHALRHWRPVRRLSERRRDGRLEPDHDWLQLTGVVGVDHRARSNFQWPSRLRLQHRSAVPMDRRDHDQPRSQRW